MNSMMHGVVAAAALVTVQAQADVKYRVEPLESPNGDYLYIRDFNNDGQILGWSDNNNFLSTPDGYQLFTGGLPIQRGRLNAQFLNDKGQVAFTYTNQAGAKPYLYSNGKSIDLTPDGPANPVAGSTYIGDLNERGQVVGLYEGKTFFFDGKKSHYLDLGLRQDLTAIPRGLTDAGVIVGGLRGNIGGNQGFKYENGKLTYLDKYEPWVINNLNQMIAATIDRGSVFVDSDGSYSPLRLGALDLNDKGWVAGWGTVPGTSDSHAYLLRNGQLTDVNDLLIPGSRKWTLTGVDDINDKGVIIGIGMFAGSTTGEQQVIATPVPEAPSLVLMFYGMGAVGFMVKRRQRRGA